MLSASAPKPASWVVLASPSQHSNSVEIAALIIASPGAHPPLSPTCMAKALMPCCLQKYGEDMAVTSIDKDSKTVTLKTGKKIQYDALISTLPLDFTLNWTGKKEWADGLTHR